VKTRRRRPTEAARRKKLKTRRAKADEQYTGTAKTIVDCMRSVGRRGNPRDFVLVSGASITDFWGVVPIPIALDSRVMLVFKGALEDAIVERLADKVENVDQLAAHVAGLFWNKGTNRRRNRSPESAKRRNAAQ
jgi:hypothetical protein